MGKKCILVVDDDRMTLDTIAAVLAEQDHIAETAQSGISALARLQRPPLPDLVLLDLFMPGMNGWTVVEQMHRLGLFHRVPVIAMTAGGVERWPEGVAERLRKPFASGVLEAAVARALANPKVT